MSDKNNLTNPIAILPQNLKAEIQQSFIYAISPSAKVEEFPDGKILITITDKLGTTQAQLYKYEDLIAARDEAVASAAAAKISEDNASISETNAQTYATNANLSLQNVIELEKKIKVSENNTIQAAQAASNDADRAEQAAGQSGYMFFYINSNGDLIYERTNNVDVDFKLVDGDLILEEVA